jgi:hypothetical protein
MAAKRKPSYSATITAFDPNPPPGRYRRRLKSPLSPFAALCQTREEPRECGANRFLVVDIARRQTFGLDQSFDHFDLVAEESKLTKPRAPTCAMLRNSNGGRYG